MTTKPPAGIQRQPQRSLSGTGMIQRPTPHRSLSQQYPSSAPVRKPDNFVDLTLDGSEAGRYGASRIAGSRLKLELSKDPKDSPTLVESPRATEPAFKSEPSRGRPRLHFDGNHPQLQGAQDSSVLTSIRGVENITGQTRMPMPRRPIQSAPPFVRGQRITTACSAKKEVRPKPYVLGVPPAAPHYLPDSYADFFPWTGDHLEDQFNDHVIRQGFFDKSHIIQNETASARLSIFPILKNKSSMQTLSSLYTSVLRQRRTHSQITSASTFKPPPRVTLTDTKRETWLKDLANPTIPLRRLSRTIPHGIRGKQLLEQCLSKKIPTARAAWLAKCVGANEIRAFKRKGIAGTFAMGGESKWIRDWTIFVEQFVESVVASCGENDWKAKILYAVRLASHLYAEHLLDREHYMDWLVASLESCPMAKVPIWLLITEIYWSDLLRYRKYGSRLVAAICDHLQSAHEDPDQDLLLPLIEKMSSLLKGLMENRSESFISPKTWMKNRKTLASCMFPESAQVSPAYRSINQRNEQLTTTDVKMELTPRRVLIELLDKSLSGPFSINLSQKCMQIITDHTTLARTVLDWATSSFRPGLTKVYVGARLLRTWSRFGIDVSEAILGFIGSGVHGPSLCETALYHLVSELTRSGHFSVSKYIQWLIARGGVRNRADMAKAGPCASRLLAELPMHDIPESICRLRRTMLSRASFSVEQEYEEIKTHTAIIESCLIKPGDDKDSIIARQDLNSTEDTISQISGLSRCIKSEIGVWIRKKVMSYAVIPQTPANAWKEDKTNEFKLTITSTDFNTMRGVLEDISDLSMLADVLKIVIPSDDLQILASACDTLNLHIEEFAAIGALDDLFDKLLARFRAVADESDATMLLTALANLAARVPGAESIAQQLLQELLRSNRKTAADACSPVSEHMAEVLQNSELEFSDEIEKVLASGTYMETSTLKRLFQMIMSRIEVSWAKSTQKQRNCATLLTRLRSFDTKQFDVLMNVWLLRFLQYSKRPSMAHVLGPLISVDCLDFREVIATSQAFLETGSELSNPHIASMIALESLVLLLGTPDELASMTTSDAYGLAVKRLHYQKDRPKEALSVIRRAMELSQLSAGDEYEYLVSVCRSEQMRNFLRYTVLQDLDAVVQGIIIPLGKLSRGETVQQLTNLVERLLDPDAGSKVQEWTLEYRIEHTLRLADDLTLPFCQLELQLIFATAASEWSNEENNSTGCLEAFERAVDSAIASNNRSWTSIIPMLDIQIARHLCQRAERLLLQLVPSIKAEDPHATATAENDDLAKKLLFVIHATTYSIQANRSSQLASQIVEKLNDIWHIASHGSESRASVVDKWLPLILDFITLHINMFDNSKGSSELRSRMLLSLTTLLLELQTYSNSPILLRIFDVALLLVDDLPEDARLNCIRSLKDKTSDPRIEYLFGYSAPPTDWLQLNQNGKLVPYPLRRWEILSEPTPVVGENDTSLSLTLFKARKM